MAQQIRAVIRMALVVVVALVSVTALVSARQSETAPAALEAGGVGSAPAPLPAASPAAIKSDPTAAAALDSLSIKTVPSAQEGVRRRTIDEFGATCLVAGDVDIAILPGAARKLDETIRAAKVSGEGWVVDGELWLGRPERAAKAFGASAVYADEQEVWIFIVTDNGPRGRELRQSRSESGKVVWFPLDQASPTACPSEGA